MPINPWYTTQQYPIWTIPLENDSGTAIDLSNLNANQITLTLKNISNEIEVTATGAITINSPATSGVITYTPSVADVANPGMYTVQVWVAYPAGPEPFLIGVWDIAPK